MGHADVAKRAQIQVDRLGRLAGMMLTLPHCCQPAKQEGLDLRPWEDMAQDMMKISKKMDADFHNSEQLMTDVEELGQKLEGYSQRWSPGSKKLNIHPHTAVPEAVLTSALDGFASFLDIFDFRPADPAIAARQKTERERWARLNAMVGSLPPAKK